MFKVFRWACGTMTREEILEDMVGVRKRLDHENAKSKPNYVMIRDLRDDLLQLERRLKNADRKSQNTNRIR